MQQHVWSVLLINYCHHVLIQMIVITEVWYSSISKRWSYRFLVEDPAWSVDGTVDRVSVEDGLLDVFAWVHGLVDWVLDVFVITWSVRAETWLKKSESVYYYSTCNIWNRNLYVRPLIKKEPLPLEDQPLGSNMDVSINFNLL